VIGEAASRARPWRFCENLPTRVLSQGQRGGVALARLALSEAMPLWILDEPFAALDAAAVERVQNFDRGAARPGRSSEFSRRISRPGSPQRCVSI